MIFYKHKKGLKISPDCSENPFFNCLGFNPEVIEKRLQRKAGKWIADKSRTIRSLIKDC